MSKAIFSFRKMTLLLSVFSGLYGVQDLKLTKYLHETGEEIELQVKNETE